MIAGKPDTVHTDNAMPVKDINSAIETEMSKLQHARLRTMGSGNEVMAEDSEKHAEMMHSEL